MADEMNIRRELKIIAKLLQSYELIDVSKRLHQHSNDPTDWEEWNVERFEEIEGDE